MSVKSVIAKERMRVHVFSPDQKEDWGLGTITKVEPLEFKDGGTIVAVSADYPSRIELDSGKITEGMGCWWYPVKEDKND